MPIKKESKTEIPTHIGIIMDGNGRWAKKRGLPRSAGHSFGTKAFKGIVKYCNEIGLKYLTVYLFSTENWKRPAAEVDNIMSLLREHLSNTEYLGDNCRALFIGDRSKLAPDIVDLIEKTEEATKNATGTTVILAVNYGGRDDIVNAVKKVCEDVKAGKLDADKIDEEVFSQKLYTKDIPDPDFILRPSGEYRLSNFLTWQSAYSELVFMNVLWPDFKPRHLDKAINEFNQRNRRFGGI